MKARQSGARQSGARQSGAEQEVKSPEPRRPLETSHEEQFNELLLYVFTGFFLLMIYDNIYKLGKDTSFY